MCKFIKLIQWPCKFTLTLLILHLILYSFFMYTEDKGIKWIIVTMCKIKKIKKKTTIKRIKKIDILMK